MRSYILICTECKNKIGCSAEELETRAIFCETCDGQEVVRCVWREYVGGDRLYEDPQGEQYKGFNNFSRLPK